MQFWKMNGAGNDFIVIDNRREQLTPSQLSALAKKVCTRRLNAGADGLMAVDSPQQGGDFRMLFFNADGSIGEMCGNGARCICRYGYETGISGEKQVIETTAGIVTGVRIDETHYRVRLNDPTKIRLQTSLEALGWTYELSYMELGDPPLPHAIVELDATKQPGFEHLRALGRALRSHAAFQKGANVNFFSLIAPDHIVEKTFERGVEDFTLACGTGTGCVVATLMLLGRVSGKNVRVDVPGGTLYVDAIRDGDRITDLFLTGPAMVVYKAELSDEALSAGATIQPI